MRNIFARALTLAQTGFLVLMGLLACQSAFGQSSNGVLREVYLNISGGTVSALTNSPTFPNSPSFESLEPIFESPSNIGDSYGQRLRALLTAPANGNYIFWIASDDQGFLYLGTDETPGQKRLICAEPQWGGSRDWDVSIDRRTNATAIFPAMNPNLPANRSDYAYGTITLAAGQRYYIEALHTEGGGGDNLAVGWQLADGTQERPIPNNRLTLYGLGPPVITQEPANVSTVEGGSATFRVALTHMIGATFQWLRNGTNVPGETNSILAVGSLTLADNSNRFRCFVANAYGTTNSSEAVLSVVADTTPPAISTVGNLGDPQVVFVVFSEPVEAASGTNLANYTINNGISLLRAAFGIDFRTVILTTTAIPASLTNILTVNNVRDRATIPNTILPNTQRTFSLTLRPLNVALLTLPREPIGPSSHRQGVLISEVMYHPTNRLDGRNLQFIEVYNSQPWFEDIGGWRVSGSADFTFPSNAVMAANSYLAVAASPADFRAVYSFTNVFGPFANPTNLQSTPGTLVLQNSHGAVVFQMSYTGDPPYPVAADGAGHSLVLARPSYGEGDARAWEASAALGGNPGAPDVPPVSGFQRVFINEFMAHTDPPQLDYIELYNYSDSSINLGGCALSDDAATNKFIIPTNTIIQARGFLVFDESQLGFGLAASGEAIFFRQPNNGRVIDAVRFSSQQNGVSMGRYPDGAPQFTRLSTPTPGTNNAPPRISDVVINEIMFDPISSDSNDEYIELFNWSTNTVDVGGWHIRDAVSFNIPSGTVMSAGSYLVIARNAKHLRNNYHNLTSGNTLGNYPGSLGNGGGRIELNMPDQVVSTIGPGQFKTNTIHVTVDEVTYASGGRWGNWSARGGSSLELRDPRSDHRLAPNWGDSDESRKSPWVNVEVTGVMDNGWADAYQLHVTLMGPGEALLDNVEVIPAGGTNIIGNGTFENDAAGWVFQGNQNQTSWEPSEGYSSAHSLHLRATGRGDTGSNRVRTQLPYTLSPGTTVTLRAKVRWLKGNPNILLRLRGNWLEAPGYMPGIRTFGTPGGPNSIAAPNIGPAITDVRHSPALPAANQAVLVQARVADPDGIAYLAVNYRIEPSTNYLTLAMTNNGAGFYSTVIPGQAGGSGGAFFIQAIDNSLAPASSTFPNNAPARECILRWGDNLSPGSLGAYHFWISQTNVSRWTAEEKKSNNPKDLTFIYGASRIIYNAGGMFHGSPYHAPGYDSPLGASCDYDLAFPADEPVLGDTSMSLLRPGNGGGDATAQTEMQAFWFASQFGLPFNFNRPVFVLANGQRREVVFLDSQRPSGGWVNEWFPSDANGDLHKIQLGFEFGDQGYSAGEAGYSVVGADLNRYLTTGGVKKQARYRQTWPLHNASPSQQNNYSNIFALVDVVMTSAAIGSDAYTTTLTNAMDVEEWFKIDVTQHLYNNYDSFSYGGGQNAFAYKPQHDTWKQLLWDVDFAFGGDPNDANLYGIGSNEHGPRNDHPPFARIYRQALIEAANGFLTAARSNPILDARYNGMVAAGAGIGSPQGIKDFTATKRSVVLAQIAANQSPFAITSNGGADFTTNRNLITLTGTAPLQVRTILVNGAAYPVSWISLNTWVLRIPLLSGTNTLLITGLDPKGVPVAGVAGSIRIVYTGVNEQPQDKIVINEIMYNPIFSGASYLEIYNTSSSNVFDLSGWRMNGIDFTFNNGTTLEAGAYLVLANDASVFASTYGASIPMAGIFARNLDPSGGTLTLIKPGATPDLDTIIDQVTYDSQTPWPPGANGKGGSLQLIDPLRDNNRVANWAAVATVVSNSSQALVAMNNSWNYNQIDNLDGVNWTDPAYNDSTLNWSNPSPSLLYVSTTPQNITGGPLGTVLALTNNNTGGQSTPTFYFRTHFNYAGSLNGIALSLQTVIDDGAVFYLNGQEVLRLGMPGGVISYSTVNGVRTVGQASLESFLLPATYLVQGDNVLAAEVHQWTNISSDLVFGLSLDTASSSQLAAFTPGARNSVRSSLPAFPLLWLNEVLPSNTFSGTNGITDRFGERDPWLELYNGGTNSINLGGYYLANNYTNLIQWAFPSNTVIGPKQFLLVWLDGQPEQSATNELHANFRLAPVSGSVVLSKGPSLSSILDYFNYNVSVAGRSYGSFPDGAVSGRRTFLITTPGGTNNPAFPSVEVRINEWMADNVTTLADPADGLFKDWFEIYNPSATVADLGGYFLSDTLTNRTQWAIPPGTIVPAGGYLLVWADNTPGLNNPSDADIHASFSLSKKGESIALFAPTGETIDVVTFGAQSADVSQGRFPDGNTSIFFMTNPTPRAANFIQLPNTPPTLAPLNNRTVDAGTLLTFTAAAGDADQPPQTLAFSLDPGAPTGASIDPASGVFTWTPAGGQSPGSYSVTIRVTDDGLPNMSATQSLTISVNGGNRPPMLAPILSLNINEGSTLTVTNSASDPDSPPQTLTFSLGIGAPDGMSIDSASGLISWTPTEAQGPGNYSITVRVTDNGEPPLSDAKSFSVSVNEVNSPPQISFPSNWTVRAETLLTFTASATDLDLPAQRMTFSVDPGDPLEAQIDRATGLFTWSPMEANTGTNLLTIRVTDDGSPPRSAGSALRVVVLPALRAKISLSGNMAAITFGAIAGRSYQVEYKNNLTDPAWTQLGENTVATSSTLTFNDTLKTSGQRFYRFIQLD